MLVEVPVLDLCALNLEIISAEHDGADLPNGFMVPKSKTHEHQLDTCRVGASAPLHNPLPLSAI